MISNASQITALCEGDRGILAPKSKTQTQCGLEILMEPLRQNVDRVAVGIKMLKAGARRESPLS